MEPRSSGTFPIYEEFPTCPSPVDTTYQPAGCCGNRIWINPKRDTEGVPGRGNYLSEVVANQNRAIAQVNATPFPACSACAPDHQSPMMPVDT